MDGGIHDLDGLTEFTVGDARGILVVEVDVVGTAATLVACGRLPASIVAHLSTARSSLAGLATKTVAIDGLLLWTATRSR